MGGRVGDSGGSQRNPLWPHQVAQRVNSGGVSPAEAYTTVERLINDALEQFATGKGWMPGIEDEDAA